MCGCVFPLITSRTYGTYPVKIKIIAIKPTIPFISSIFKSIAEVLFVLRGRKEIADRIGFDALNWFVFQFIKLRRFFWCGACFCRLFLPAFHALLQVFLLFYVVSGAWLFLRRLLYFFLPYVYYTLFLTSVKDGNNRIFGKAPV